MERELNAVINNFPTIQYGIKVYYSPLLEDRQVIKIYDFNTQKDCINCGFGPYFFMLANYGTLDYAVDWGIDIAKKNVKFFIENFNQPIKQS